MLLCKESSFMDYALSLAENTRLVQKKPETLNHCTITDFSAMHKNIPAMIYQHAGRKTSLLPA